MTRLAPPVRPHARILAAFVAVSALATAALLASPIAAAGQPAMDVPQTTVTYHYGDLATEQGVHELYQRIKTAAQAVCPAYDPLDLAGFEYSRECQRQAVARAIAKVGNARLAAVYAQKAARRG